MGLIRAQRRIFERLLIMFMDTVWVRVRGRVSAGVMIRVSKLLG